jgi:hypothetical protein
MSKNSLPRQPILMHSPMWLNAFSFSDRIMLFVRLSLIREDEILATHAQYMHSYQFPSTPLPLPMAEPQMCDPSLMHTRISAQITQFQDMYDHCTSQTVWSDHNIFDLTSSHFDSYCMSLTYHHGWLPPVLPL